MSTYGPEKNMDYKNSATQIVIKPVYVFGINVPV